MHAHAREKIFVWRFQFTKSIHTNYNYKTYPSGGNIGADHTARLRILISTLCFLYAGDRSIVVYQSSVTTPLLQPRGQQ